MLTTVPLLVGLELESRFDILATSVTKFIRFRYCWDLPGVAASIHYAAANILISGAFSLSMMNSRLIESYQPVRTT